MSKTSKKTETLSTETFAVSFLSPIKGQKSRRVEGISKPVNREVTEWGTRHEGTLCGSRDVRVSVELDKATNLIRLEATKDIPAGTNLLSLVAIALSPSDVMRVQKSLVAVGEASKLNAKAQEEELERIARTEAAKSAKELWSFGMGIAQIAKALSHKYGIDEQTAREVAAINKPAA
tara:strand:+ start:234 stop:764 length:531 start_codon:yes stop_codon:yes gene_type:complete